MIKKKKLEHMNYWVSYVYIKVDKEINYNYSLSTIFETNSCIKVYEKVMFVGL